MSIVNDDCIQRPFSANGDTSTDHEYWYVDVPAVDYVREAFFGALSILGFPTSYNPESDVAADYGSGIVASLTQFSGAFVTDQAANTFWAGPGSGVAALPTFRAIVPADIVTALTTPPAIGAATPNTGKFTTLEATGTTGARALTLNTGGIGLDAGERLFWKNSGGSYVTVMIFGSNALSMRGGTAGVNWQNSGGNTFMAMSDAGAFTFRNAIATTGVMDVQIRAGAGQGITPTPLFRLQDASGVAMISVLANARDVALDTTDGTKWGTATTQKQAWWGATPVIRPVLATGAGKTADDIITMLQSVGLCSQT